jgi:hypothetical protein
LIGSGVVRSEMVNLGELGSLSVIRVRDAG